MNEDDFLAERFEEHRGRLKAVAYRMLGSLTEADDTVQEAWLRLARDQSVAADDDGGPEDQALIADSVGLALLVVLESLNPVERLAFVLHDMFGVPFEEIAPIVDRTPTAARKLASRPGSRCRARLVPDGRARGRLRPPAGTSSTRTSGCAPTAASCSPVA